VVDPVYADRAPFAFTGRIHRVDFDVRQPGAQEQAALHHAETAGQHARHIES
jgi:arylsulfatase